MIHWINNNFKRIIKYISKVNVEIGYSVDEKKQTKSGIVEINKVTLNDVSIKKETSEIITDYNAKEFN